MSGRKKEGAEGSAEGWESLAEESEGSLSPSRELEEALAEAAAAVEEKRKPARAGDEGAASDDETAQELKRTQDRLLRLHADFENFKRRALKERTEVHQYGHQNLVKELLPSVDNLDRAIDHARQSGGDELQSLLQGVELVRREILAAFAKNGVTPVEALGKPFDPKLHEAMAQRPDASVPPNTVVEELQKGYVLRDRLLRPARVVVARKPEEGEAGGQ